MNRTHVPYVGSWDMCLVPGGVQVGQSLIGGSVDEATRNLVLYSESI